ncbi:MAG: hypothetical protein S0880_07040 [Actinomycetota bacterium]|nr:hypothetical protein [Actinomycetota bacterium]
MSSLERSSPPSISRTVLHPVTGGLAAAGVVAGLLAGNLLLGIVLALVLVGFRAGWGAMRSGAAETVTTNTIDPFAVGEPWRLFVRDAVQAQTRFRDATVDVRDGPIRERLDRIGAGVDESVTQVWETAQRGHALRQARNNIDTAEVRRKLEATGSADLTDADDVTDRVRGAFESQLSSAERMDSVIERSTKRLQLLTAQLDEAVARAAELAVHTSDLTQFDDVGADIDHVVEEMEALRLAIEETGGSSSSGSVGPA